MMNGEKCVYFDCQFSDDVEKKRWRRRNDEWPASARSSFARKTRIHKKRGQFSRVSFLRRVRKSRELTRARVCGWCGWCVPRPATKAPVRLYFPSHSLRCCLSFALRYGCRDAGKQRENANLDEARNFLMALPVSRSPGRPLCLCAAKHANAATDAETSPRDAISACFELRNL